MTHLRRAIEYIWKVPVSGLSLSVGTIATAAILSSPPLPPGPVLVIRRETRVAC